jgi:hypothetical protein
MRIAGIILIILSVVAFLIGDITYTVEAFEVELDDFEATVRQRRRIPLAPLPAMVLLIAGVALLAVSTRRRPRP